MSFQCVSGFTTQQSVFDHKQISCCEKTKKIEKIVARKKIGSKFDCPSELLLEILCVKFVQDHVQRGPWSVIHRKLSVNYQKSSYRNFHKRVLER